MEYRSDTGSLGGARKTPQGGLIAPANLTRVGVFVYDYADGTRVRELRHPDEVFKADSLSSLAQAPLTVLHPGEVTPANWRQVSVGHVDGTPKQSGEFVAADLRVMDGDTIAKIDSKDLTELSCGYRCNVVLDAGTWNGETYDARQTDINYNHVAIGPKDWGRAGNSVKIRLDGPNWLAPGANSPIALLSDDIMKLDANGKPVAETPVVAAPVAIVKDEASDALRGQVEFLKAENARITADSKAKVDALTADLAKLTDAAKADAVKALVAASQTILGLDFKADGKSAHEVRSAVVAKLAPSLKLDGKSESFVEAAYEMALANAETASKALGAVQVALPENGSVRTDAAQAEDLVTKAAKDAEYRSKNAWRGDSWLTANPRK